MADTNLKDFSVNWVLFGLLFFSLLTFSISFMSNNNPLGLGNSEDIFKNSGSSMKGKLLFLTNESDTLLNITSETNPERSLLGSRDSVATSYGITGASKGFFESTKIFMGWVLVGDSGKLLISVFGGLLGLVSLFFIIKFFRTGF